MRWIVLTTESSVVTVPRRLRLRERDLYPFKCDLPPCERRTFPVADILKRLVAHFFVLSLGIFVSLMCSPLAGRAVDESPGRPENGQKYAKPPRAKSSPRARFSLRRALSVA